MFSPSYFHAFRNSSLAVLCLFLITNAFSSPLQNSNPSPPRTPVCSPSLGKPDYDECEAAIALIPRDPRDRPIVRNFYVKPEDQSAVLPNVQLPLTKTVGGCSVDLVMAAEFAGVPHDTAVWRDIWGPARTILPQCLRREGHGGIVTHNGVGTKMEIVVYATKSLYGLKVLVDRSTDPVARAIAVQEFLDLLGLAAGPTPAEINAQVASLENNQTVTPPLITSSNSSTVDSGSSTA